MLKALLLPILAVLGGGVGFFLRRWELATAFESTGLAIPWAPASIALIILSLAVVLICALLCRNPQNKLTDYTEAIACPNNWLCLIALALSAACLLVAGLLGFRQSMVWGSPILRKLLWVMCIVSFFSVLVTAWNNFRGTNRKYSLALLAPGYTVCLWLVSSYQLQASDPVILDYMYELFAVICTLLAIYFTASFSFGRGRAWRCAFFNLLGIYFSIVTFADNHDGTIRLLLIFSILYQLTSVVVLLRRAFTALPKHLLDHSNTTQEVNPDE